ncbi:MAG: CoA transferase [Euryarchaeota archaeon]|nr:CoA transferase [Euryarchaeota archaeon]
MGLLDGVRILDLSQMLSGPYSTLVLGDMGAEVIKIEPPGEGDRTRTMPHHHFGGLSGYFISINRNKKSVTLDLKVPEAREVFYDLVRKSDVVFDNFRPGVLERLQIDYNTLGRIKPDIISVSITAFGEEGPYKDLPAFDLTIQAIGGAMSVTGEPGGAPVRLGLPMGDLAGAVFASNAVAAALYKRERTGEGSRVDVSLLDALVSMHTYVGQYVLQGGEVPGPVGSGHQSVVPYRAFMGGDGEWFVIAVFTEKFWGLFCKMLGIEGLEKDPRFEDNPRRCVNREALFQILEEEFEKRPAAEWLKKLDKAGVPAAPINKLDRTFADPQVLLRKMVVEIEVPGAGKVKTTGNPVKVLGEEERFEAPAQLGQHTDEVLSGLLGYSKERIAQLREKKAL